MTIPNIHQLTPEFIEGAKIYAAENSLAAFVKQAWHVLEPGTPLRWGWHLDAICNTLQAVTEGRIKRLMICVPPGSMKSLITAVFWPCWEWIKRPSLRIVAASHSREFALRDNIRARDLLTSQWFQDRWPLAMKDDVNTTMKFINDQTGYRQALPYSKLTGGRGDRLVIDDALTVMDAFTAERELVNTTFLRSATSRLNDPKTDPIVIIMQRVHQNDLIGMLLEKKLGYVMLKIPMEYDGDKNTIMLDGEVFWEDPRTEMGELMLEARWSREELIEYKVDAFAYASQYQQEPVPLTDGFFESEWFKRFDPTLDPGEPDGLPKHLNYYMSSDHALGLSGKSDFNVVRVWGADEFKNLYLVDSFRERCDLKTALGIATDSTGRLQVGSKGALAMVKKWAKKGCHIRIWFAEPDNNFKSNREILDDTMIATGTTVRIEYSANHGKDKEVKAGAYRTFASAGKVFLPNGAIGDDAIREYIAFPAGKHDDQVDADSIIAREIHSAKRAFIPVEEKKKKPEDYKVLQVSDGNAQKGFF